jgi:hypothetical protein
MQRTKRASASNARRYSPKQGALEERPPFPGFDLRTIRGLRLRIGGEH